MNKLKICAISDLHGYFPTIEKCDILFIAGDISPYDIQFNKPKMKQWLETTFADWINSLPVERVYMIPGNHDAYLEGISKTNLNAFLNKVYPKLCYLKHEGATYISDTGNSYKIFGTPYCHIFGNWPFMRSDDYMEEAFKEIPDEVDFLITHDAPYCVDLQDVCLDHRRIDRRFEHIGNLPLVKRLSKLKYKWMFHGHLHSSDHIPTEYCGGQVVNVSYCNESGLPAYKPFYTEIDEYGT